MPKDHKDHIQQILLPGYNYCEQYDISLISSEAFEILSHWCMSFTSNGLFAYKQSKF